jgi:hypothetical protein
MATLFQVPSPGQNGYFYMRGEGWMMRLVIFIARMTVSLDDQLVSLLRGS